MKQPVVSIITPCYNCEKTIIKTFNSLKAQTFKDFEWIVIDDCSEDKSVELISKIKQVDPRVVLIKAKTNCGAAKSRNIGIKNARGKYIAFLDADDIWYDFKLETQLRFMKKNNYFFSYSNYDVEYPNGKVVEFRPKKDHVTYRDLLKSNDVGCLTAMFDKSVVKEILMPEDCYKREDLGAWLDITKKGIIGYKIDLSLGKYFISPGSVSSKKLEMFKYQYLLYRKHEGFGILKSFYFTMIASVRKLLKKY